MRIADGTTRLVDCDGVAISATVTGDGPPILLLHGYPETKAMWRDVTVALADRFTLVAADLRGYGDSDKPAGDVYSKREMARDQLALMRALGFERFAVAGHDRGARVGHRLALDHPDSVTALVVLDIVPTLHMFENVDRAMASSYFHWFFLARPDMPEQLISASPEVWLRSRFSGRGTSGSDLLPAVYDEYARCWDADVIRASCADYRAAATVDLEHDAADRDAGHRVSVPVLALWGTDGYVGQNFDVTEVWRGYADDVRGEALPVGHYLAEESPERTAELLGTFVAGVAA